MACLRVALCVLALVLATECAVKEYLKFDDLQALGSSPNAIYMKIKKSMGIYPDGLSLNYENYKSGISITSENNKWCYKILGETDFSAGKQSSPTKSVMGSNVAYNRGSSPAKVSLAVTGTWQETSGYSSSITNGMSFSAGFALEGVFEAGGSFSFEATSTSSHSKSISRSYTSTVEVTVPPHSKKRVSMVANMKTVEMHFKKPISVKGQIGANFPDRVRNHYFWYWDISSLVPKTTAEITGTITGTKAFDLHTEIEETVPLTYKYF